MIEFSVVISSPSKKNETPRKKSVKKIKKCFPIKN